MKPREDSEKPLENLCKSLNFPWASHSLPTFLWPCHVGAGVRDEPGRVPWPQPLLVAWKRVGPGYGTREMGARTDGWGCVPSGCCAREGSMEVPGPGRVLLTPAAVLRGGPGLCRPHWPRPRPTVSSSRGANGCLGGLSVGRAGQALSQPAGGTRSASARSGEPNLAGLGPDPPGLYTQSSALLPLPGPLSWH